MNGGWVSRMSSDISVGYVFLAELLAMEAGLHHAWELGHRHVSYESDCRAAIDIMQQNGDIFSFRERDTISHNLGAPLMRLECDSNSKLEG